MACLVSDHWLEFCNLVRAVSPDNTYNATVLYNIGHKTSEHRGTTTSIQIILNGECVRCRHVVQQIEESLCVGRAVFDWIYFLIGLWKTKKHFASPPGPSAYSCDEQKYMQNMIKKHK